MKGACVYRIFGDAGELLYVGHTTNLGCRIETHQRERPWWRDVARITVEHVDDVEVAMEREQEAIAIENPLHNRRPSEPVVAGWRRRAERRAAAHRASEPCGGRRCGHPVCAKAVSTGHAVSTAGSNVAHAFIIGVEDGEHCS